MPTYAPAQAMAIADARLLQVESVHLSQLAHSDDEAAVGPTAQIRLHGRSVRQRRTLAMVFGLLSAMLLLMLLAWNAYKGPRVSYGGGGLERRRGTKLLLEQQDDRCCNENTAECFECSMRLPCLGSEGSEKPECVGPCGPLDYHHDYFGGDLYSIGKVAGPRECCAHCRAEKNCTAWTWGGDLSYDPHSRQRCYLKHQLGLKRLPAYASTSGFPTDYLASFQIRSRQGLCMARIGEEISLEACGDASLESQQWSVDVRMGRIKTQDGFCLGSPQWKRLGGVVHLKPCLVGILGQNWVIEGDHGLIANKAGYCVVAKEPSRESSGLQMARCDKTQGGQQWDLWYTDSLGDPKMTEALQRLQPTTTTFRAPGASLFCFALMLPDGSEQDLMTSHAAKRKSIFACEEHVVFSAKEINLGGGIWTQSLPVTNLYVGRGGAWNSYLNTPSFIACWNQIRWSGRYKNFDWLVKVDPDTVFLPERLKTILLAPEFREAEIKRGVAIKNCDTGLHGPLEVVSSRAMEVFGKELEQCDPKPQEDYFLSSCLVTLGVEIRFREDVLADHGCLRENHTQKDPDWWRCQSRHAAFHPFKTPKELEDCYARAVASPPS